MVAPDKLPRKRPKQARARATFDAIVEAADLLLDDHDIDDLTIQGIADRAGVSVGSLYQYFPTKDAIIATVLERDVERVYQGVVMLFEASKELPPAEVLAIMVRGVVANYTGRLDYYRRVLPDIGRLERDGLIRNLIQEASNLVLTMMRTRPDEFNVPAAHHETAAFLVTRAMNGLAHAAIIEDPERARDPAFVEELTRLLVSYMVGPATS